MTNQAGCMVTLLLYERIFLRQLQDDTESRTLKKSWPNIRGTYQLDGRRLVPRVRGQWPWSYW